MKILYIHQYFTSPESPGGTRSYFIAKEMLRQGHLVTMLTSDQSGEGKLVRRENLDGIDVIRIRNHYNNSMGVPRRILSFLSFMLMSTFIGLREKNVGLIYATSTPLTVGVPALINKFLRGVDYIFEVRDLWPEVPIQMGALKSSGAIKLLQLFEKTIYKHARLIIALSPGMKRPIDNLGFAEKTIMVPNMAKPKEFYPREANESVVDQFDINSKATKIVYFGTLGLANNVPYITDEIEYAARCNLPVQFVIIGDGAMRKQAEEKLRSCSKDYFTFLGKLNMEDVSAVVNECHISLTSFMNLPILETNSPNKFFDTLSAGKPTAINVSGWIREIIEEHKCGFFVDPEVPGDLTKKSLDLVKDTTRYEQYCRNARELSLERYDRSKLSTEIVNSLRDLAGSPKTVS